MVECVKSGLLSTAFNYATMLLRPEYRDNIDPKYKKKIEQLVRHPQKNEVEEPATPCPNCNFKLLEYGLTCPGCQINIPYCILTVIIIFSFGLNNRKRYKIKTLGSSYGKRGFFSLSKVRLSCHFFRVYEVCILIVDKRLSLKS